MSGKASLFSEIKEKYNGSISLGDKGKFKFIGINKVGQDSSKSIDNVYLVNDLNFTSLVFLNYVIKVIK